MSSALQKKNIFGMENLFFPTFPGDLLDPGNDRFLRRIYSGSDLAFRKSFETELECLMMIIV